MNERDIAKGILDKMGMAYTEKISTDRAMRKIKRNFDYDTDYSLTGIEVTFLNDIGMLVALPEPKPTAKKTKTRKRSTVKTASAEEPKPKAKAPVKKAASTKPPKKKLEPKAEPKPTPARRPDWMTTATRAILSNGVKTMSEAGAKAAADYLAEGGRETPNNRQNGTLYTSYAIKVLAEVGIAEADSDGQITRL